MTKMKLKFNGVLLVLMAALAGSAVDCGERVDTTLGTVLYQRSVLRSKSLLVSPFAPAFKAGYERGLQAAGDETPIQVRTREDGAFVTGFQIARELLNTEDQDAAKQHMGDITRMLEEGPEVVEVPTG